MKLYIPNIMKNGSMALRMIFIMCSLLVLSAPDANATHIVGGNLTYRCLGNNQYEIRLSLRRDCLLGAADAQFDDPASVGFFDATTNMPLAFVGFGGELLMAYNADDTLNQILESDCGVIGNPVCVHQTTYVDTIFLPFWANGYKIVYQRCCRNGSINNILNPLLTGLTLLVEMSSAAQSVCKSSPQIGAYPPVYICVNKDIDFIPNAFDPQGDSLAFRLETPFSGGDIINNMPQPPNPPPYDLVNWRPPYSLANIMGGIPLQIDPVTGRLTGRPNTVGQFIITIVVTSYRNGVKLAETRVDFQYNVRSCRDVPTADFTSPGLNCEDLSMTFTNTSQLADEYLWIFDFGNPNSDTSTEENPTYTYDQPGFYDVALIVNDSALICFDTIIQQIGVFISELNAEFSYSSTSCTDGIVLDVVDLSTDPAFPIVGWEWLLTHPGGVIPSTEQNPTFTFDVEGISTVFLVLIVTDINGCTDAIAKSFPVQEFDIQFNPDADSICSGESVLLLIGGDPALTYIWFDSLNGLDLTEPWNPLAYPGITTTYYVTVTDGVCTLTDSIHVNVQQLPNLEFDYTTDCKNLTVQFINSSTNSEDHFWDFGDPDITTDTSSLDNPSYTYTQPGEYIVTLSSRDGCDVSVTDTITANIILDQLPEAIVNCFMDSIQLNPGFNADYNYIWSPAEFLDDETSQNPTAGVVNDTWFYVTITEDSLPGCEIIDSIQLLIPDDFEINTGDETITSCDFSDITLTATITGNTNVEIVCKDLEGNLLSTGSVFVVNPENTTTYIGMAMDTLGCSKSDTVTVLKPDPTFVINIIPNDTAYCYIQTITLVASSVAGVTFEWYNANDELIGTGISIDVTPGTEACFYVIGTDPLGCQAADTVCLSPTFFDINISSEDESFCLGGVATLTVNSINGVTYEWFDANNQSVGTGLSVDVSPDVVSCYHVVGTDALGCQDADTICVTPIDFNLSIMGDEGVCLGDETTITVTDNNGQNLTYLWDPTGSILPSIVVQPLETTTYSVTVTNVDLGCVEVLSYTVEVFTFSPAIVITADPDTVNLTESSQLTVNQNPDFDYVWSASTGEFVDPIFNPVVTPTESTTYCVTVTDDHGCIGTACISVALSDLFCDDRDIFIPNAFTPNNDGENDMLFVRSNFVASMELNIYNRWGEKVFTSTDQNIGWDGTFNGKQLSPDVFGYYLTVNCPNEESYFKKGNITLLH